MIFGRLAICLLPPFELVEGSYSIFVRSPFSVVFLVLTVLVIGSVALNKLKGRKKTNG